MKEYNRKFTQVSKYAPTMVVDSRAKMNKFVMGISDLVVNECMLAMLIDSIDISSLMVHTNQLSNKSLRKLIGSEESKGR